MNNLKRARKFSRKRDQRRSFLRALTLSLLDKGKIKTTEARAKEISQICQKLISKAKDKNLSSVKFLNSFLNNKDIVKKLTSEIAPKYKSRKGGYVRIIKLGPRKSDSASMVIIELV